MSTKPLLSRFNKGESTIISHNAIPVDKDSELPVFYHSIPTARFVQKEITLEYS